MSVEPRFAEALLSGKKSVELRKRTPVPNAGDEIFVYAKAPQKELVGSVICAGVVTANLPELWREVRTRAAVSKAEFESYFGNRKTGTGLVVAKGLRLQRPLPLSEVRAQFPRFQPPQSPVRLRDELWEILVKRRMTRRP